MCHGHRNFPRQRALSLFFFLHISVQFFFIFSCSTSFYIYDLFFIGRFFFALVLFPHTHTHLVLAQRDHCLKYEMKTWRLLRIDDGIDDNGSMFFFLIFFVYISTVPCSISSLVIYSFCFFFLCVRSARVEAVMQGDGMGMCCVCFLLHSHMNNKIERKNISM